MAQKSLPPVVYILGFIACIIGLRWLLRSVPASSDTDGYATQDGQPTDLMLLGDTFSGYSTFRDLKFQDSLKQAGVDLEYRDVFEQSERAAMLDRLEADLLVTTLDRFLQNQPRGQIVALIDRTVGADAVVLNTVLYPQLASINDLSLLYEDDKTPTIVYATDTPSEYLARVLDVQFSGFNLANFEIRGVAEASEAWSLLRDPRQGIAVAVLWEPFVTQAKREGHTVILSSNDAPNTIVDVLVASEYTIDLKSQAIETLLESYYRHIDDSMQDNTRLQQQIQSDGSLSGESAALVLDGIDFFTSIEAKRWMQDGTLDRRLEVTGDILTFAGDIEEPPRRPQTLYTDRFIRRAVDNTNALISTLEAENPELAAALRGQSAKSNAAVEREEILAAAPIGNLDARGDVKFTSGSVELTEDSLDTLDRIAATVREFNSDTIAICIVGHTSQSGTTQSNLDLSQQRAQAVGDYLQSRGFEGQILAEGRGYSEPLPGLEPTDSRNQRTEIRLVCLEP